MKNKVYCEINKKLSKKYPELSFILDNPDNFQEVISQRFNIQKELFPNNPYSFDYSEIGMPLVLKTNHDLSKVLIDLNSDLFSFKKQSFISKIFKNTLKELMIKRRYCLALIKLSNDSLKSNSIDYKTLYEFSYWYSRFMGVINSPSLTLADYFLLKIDRILEGYRELSIKKEFDMFQRNSFNIFQTSTPVGGFTRAEKTFGIDYNNQDQLKIILVPTHISLDPDILMRLSSYNIFLIAVTEKPEAADGFVRPSGDFWMHDIRHSSAIYDKRVNYNNKNSLNLKQEDAIRTQIDLWKHELDQERKLIQDKDLKGAIGFLLFNTHHDRGVPMLPSSYSKKYVSYIPFSLYLILTISKQPINFEEPIKNINKAYFWLKEFWEKRLDEELKINSKL